MKDSTRNTTRKAYFDSLDSGTTPVAKRTAESMRRCEDAYQRIAANDKKVLDKTLQEIRDHFENR